MCSIYAFIGQNLFMAMKIVSFDTRCHDLYLNFVK